MGAITTELVETYQKRDAKGRKVTHRERRRELIEAYRGSGMTMASFAKREGIGIVFSVFVGHTPIANWSWSRK